MTETWVNAETVNDRVKLAFSRAVARALRHDPSLIGKAWEWLAFQRSRGGLLPGHAEWEAILELPIDQICDLLRERSERMTRLRISSPFVGVLPQYSEERRIRLRRKSKQWLIGKVDEGRLAPNDPFYRFCSFNKNSSAS